MSPSYPSIQSFYKRDIPKSAGRALESPSKPRSSGDGFTERELEQALDPLTRPWNPEREYEETTIDQLAPGPRHVVFLGRIVNYNTMLGHNPKQPKAAGWHYLIIKDNTAAISLKLYFAQKEYPLKLGHLVSIWTAFISDNSRNETHVNTTTNANLFPGRNTSDHIMIHTPNASDRICNIPLEHRKGQPLSGLMTLESYVSGGYEIPDPKILVCVKSIGARKKITVRKTKAECQVCETMLFDHTGELKLTLWGDMYEAVNEWQPSCTVLLISNPSFRTDYAGKGTISVARHTMIERDPEFADAEWLRKYAVGLTKKESLCMRFPEGVWDVEQAVYGVSGALFTLADVDEWVRDNPTQIFTGWINVTILELSLVSYHRKNMLLCAECCGIPVYSNDPRTSCPHCDRALTLTLNPRVVGTLIDETGCIAAGKLVWSARAWEELWGRSGEQLGWLSVEDIGLLEQRSVGMRCHLCFGWEEGVGRLAILGMRP